MIAPDKIIARAKEYLGIKYKFGAEASSAQLPSLVKALDCSEFVEIVYRRFGIMLPDGSYNQVNCGLVKRTTVGHALRTSAALLFHVSPGTGKVDHVGISMADGWTIEATPPKVQIKKRSPGFWARGRLVQHVHYPAAIGN